MSDSGQVISRDRTNFFLAACVSPFFIAIGVWILLDNIVAGIVIGVPAIAYFGLIFYQALKALFDKRPGLIVDADGIRYSIAGGPEMSVPWTDMKGVSVLRFGPRRFIAIDVRDPDKYRARRSRLQRLAAALWPDKSASPVQIPVGTLKIGCDDLLATLSDRIEKGGGGSRAGGAA